MAEYKWPAAEKRKYIGKRISRLDGPLKVSGKAKYAYDVNRPGMLHGKILHSPYANAKIVSIDTSAAEKMPGVRAVKLVQGPGTNLQWAGDEIAIVVAVDEMTAKDAIRAIKVEYERLPHVVNDEKLEAVPDTKKRRTNESIQGEPDKAFAEADVTVEGYYGNAIITHCCLESHGQVVEWKDAQNVLIHPSTQAVSTIGNDLAKALEIPAGNVELKMDFIGGGFGSKFSIDRWGTECGKVSKMADGKPVKLMLERDAELMIAGSRPSMYAKVKVGAKKDGTMTAWQSECWGTGGVAGGGAPALPYLLRWPGGGVPNYRSNFISVSTNTAPQRAWRAPAHPQMAVITMGALDDLAAALKMDPIEFLKKNINLFQRPEVYTQELDKAMEMSNWKANWRPRGEGAPGSTKTIKRGLGVSMHTWGGGGGASNADVTIYPDGSVDLKCGTQDLGVGTITVLSIVVAETMGLPMEAVKIFIGSNRYPASNPSGGSTTVGGISSSSRRAATDALNQLLAKVAPTLGVKPEELEAVDSKIRVIANPSKSMTWKEACAKLGSQPITVRGTHRQGNTELSSSGVGGVQIADVSVDIETGLVKMNNFYAVQDCGLIMDMKTCESQVFGAMIMGVAYSLFEERIMDDQTGRVLNPNMEFYKLGGLMDIGTMKVHMMTGKGYDERGPIGVGEPPTNSPGAAISNAVANAIGVRVPTVPLTPDKVLAALASKKGGSSNAKI